MPAELIKKTDTNRLAFPKINQAIQDSYEAVTKAKKADDNSNQALNKTRSVQSQINQLVIEGDSSVEAAQARVDDEGRAYSTLQERLNAEKSQIKTDIETTKDQVLNDYKNFYLDKAAEVYLYDLQLAMGTVNQSIQIDEVKKEIYATQAYHFSDDKLESYVISRLTMGGKLLDTMTVRYGGHGTSIGLEKVGNTIYIWSNMHQPNTEKTAVQTQYLTRFPYRGGTEVNISHSSVERIQEFPDPKQYANPIIDTKNGLLALRKTDTRSGLHSFIETYKISDYKKGVRTPIHTFHFIEEMDEGVLQGITFDNTDLFISFGSVPEDHHLFHIDLRTSEILTRIDRPIGRNSNGDFEEDFGELEGLYLYTNPDTGFKTLLTVVVTDASGRRRQKLFAFSWNAGVQEFMSYTVERTQNVKLTRDDGKAKRIPVGTRYLKDILEPGDYYMTTGETNDLLDHPRRGVAGWYLTVTGGDTSGSVKQTLTRNSTSYTQDMYRIVSTTGDTSPWWVYTVTEYSDD